MPNALLIYPEQPQAFWEMTTVLDFLGKKAVSPPLGLLTVAALFPPEYDLRVADLNVAPLQDADLDWADIAFISAIIVQRNSLKSVVKRCRRAGIPVVAGGPYPTTYHDEIEGVDHFVLGEVEEYFHEFLQDLASGTAKEFYREPRKPDITRTPIPRYDLINLNDYFSTGLQFSRGCPFDCEFCDITKLFGRVSRTKTPSQVLEEFDYLYRLGWRGPVFLVDDNFIGNKRDVMKLLPVLSEWQKERNYPFALHTEASANLARLDTLMDAMVEAGFDAVFMGLETPNPEALLKTKKPQNVSKREENYLNKVVHKIQQKGMEVQGGFILGLDGDDEGMFDAQINFIQDAGIPVAFVNLLGALKGTDMYHRLQAENRLLKEEEDPFATIKSNELNFEPEIDREVLIDGYMRVITTLYDPTLENYFERCLTLIKNLKPVPHLSKPMTKMAIYTSITALRNLLSNDQVPAYNRFISEVSKHHPRMLPRAFNLVGKGYHFEKIARRQVVNQEFKRTLKAELTQLEKASSLDHREVERYRQQMFKRIEARYRSFPTDLRYSGDGIEDAFKAFREVAIAESIGVERNIQVPI